MADILARMRQLIGTISQWTDDNLVIGDGELVLERTDDGGVRIKVGNGVDQYLDLPYVTSTTFGDSYTWRNVTGTRIDNTDYTSPGHPIQVSYTLGCASNDGVAQIVVAGIAVAYCTNGGNGAMAFTISAVVPPNTVYRVNQSNANTRAWFELRAD